MVSTESEVLYYCAIIASQQTENSIFSLLTCNKFNCASEIFCAVLRSVLLLISLPTNSEMWSVS